jgi:hypothetical protein
MSSTVRSSPSASADASRMAVNAGRACSGWSSSRCSPTPACTLISEMLWASTSCSSWAMRSRSSLAWRRASSARVAASSATRCWRARHSSVPVPTAINQAASAAAAAHGGQRSWCRAGDTSPTTTNPSTRLTHATRRRPRITALT